MHREILLVYASDRDRPGLDHAIELATAHRARLTIAVPVPRLPLFVCLVPVDADALREEIVACAQRTAHEAVARVPADLPVTTRCVPRALEGRLALEIAAGGFDLCVVCAGRHEPGELRGGLGARVVRWAQRRGVAFLTYQTMKTTLEC